MFDFNFTALLKFMCVEKFGLNVLDSISLDETFLNLRNTCIIIIDINCYYSKSISKFLYEDTWANGIIFIPFFRQIFAKTVVPHSPGFGIVPSNYYCTLETLTFYMDICFYISLCICHEMIVIFLKYHSR